MQDYNVNVRAIVRGRETTDESAGTIDGWEVYDYDTESDGRVVIRCDQQVAVQAGSENEAIEKAKAAATTIVVPDFDVDGIDLWVDDAIDVSLKDAVSAPGVP